MSMRKTTLTLLTIALLSACDLSGSASKKVIECGRYIDDARNMVCGGYCPDDASGKKRVCGDNGNDGCDCAPVDGPCQVHNMNAGRSNSYDICGGTCPIGQYNQRKICAGKYVKTPTGSKLTCGCFDSQGYKQFPDIVTDEDTPPWRCNYYPGDKNQAVCGGVCPPDFICDERLINGYPHYQKVCGCFTRVSGNAGTTGVGQSE